jgi:hypothetical protein
VSKNYVEMLFALDSFCHDQKRDINGNGNGGFSRLEMILINLVVSYKHVIESKYMFIV